MREQVNGQILVSKLGEIASDLERDPLFEGATIDRLGKYLSKAKKGAEGLLSDTLQGMSEAYRYGGLLVLKSLFPPSGSVAFGTDLGKEEARFLAGNVVIEGHLRIPDNAMLVVTGDLEVHGNLVETRAWYSLIGVGGRLRARNVLVSGELLCPNDVESTEDYITFRNDYSGRIGRLTTKRYINDDHSDYIVELVADQKIVGHPLPNAEQVFHRDVLDLDGSRSPPKCVVSWDRLADHLLKPIG